MKTTDTTTRTPGRNAEPMPHERRASVVPKPPPPAPPPPPTLVADEEFVKFRHLSTTLLYVNEILESDVSIAEIRSVERHPKTVMARELCSLFMHFLGDASYPDMGEQMNKSHSACVTQVHRLITLWLKSMDTDELKDLMLRRAMKP